MLYYYYDPLYTSALNVKVGVDYATMVGRKCYLASNSSVDVMKGPMVVQDSAIRYVLGTRRFLAHSSVDVLSAHLLTLLLLLLLLPSPPLSL